MPAAKTAKKTAANPATHNAEESPGLPDHLITEITYSPVHCELIVTFGTGLRRFTLRTRGEGFSGLFKALHNAGLLVVGRDGNKRVRDYVEVDSQAWLTGMAISPDGYVWLDFSYNARLSQVRAQIPGSKLPTLMLAGQLADQATERALAGYRRNLSDD